MFAPFLLATGISLGPAMRSLERKAWVGLKHQGEPHALIEGYFARNLESFLWWD